MLTEQQVQPLERQMGSTVVKLKYYHLCKWIWLRYDIGYSSSQNYSFPILWSALWIASFFVPLLNFLLFERMCCLCQMRVPTNAKHYKLHKQPEVEIEPKSQCFWSLDPQGFNYYTAICVQFVNFRVSSTLWQTEGKKVLWEWSQCSCCIIIIMSVQCASCCPYCHLVHVSRSSRLVSWHISSDNCFIIKHKIVGLGDYHCIALGYCKHWGSGANLCYY